MEQRKLKVWLMAAMWLLFASCVYAERYRILYLNSNHIKIGNKIAKVGDYFEGKDQIKWSSNKQAMKIEETSSGRRLVVAAQSMRKAKKSSLAEYLLGLVNRNHLSTYGIQRTQNDNAEFYLLDTLFLSRPYMFYPQSEARMEWKERDNTFVSTISISPNGRNYILPRELLNGRKPKKIKVDIVENSPDGLRELTAYKDLMVYILPIR